MLNSLAVVHATDQQGWWSWLVMRTSCPLAMGGFFWHLPISLWEMQRTATGAAYATRTRSSTLDYASCRGGSTTFYRSTQSHTGQWSARSSDCGVTHLHRTPTPDPHQTFRPKKFLAAIYQAPMRCLGDSICHCAGRASPWRKCVPTGENEEKNPRLPQ